MPYIRVSLMQPKRGQEERVRGLLDELVTYYEAMEGYVTGYRLSHDDTGRVGRIGIWDRAESAEHAATTDHDMALRAQLNMAVQDGSHEELSFEGTEAPKRP